MTNVDYVDKKVIGQRTSVVVLLVEILPTLSEIAQSKSTEQTNVFRVCSTNKRKCFNVELLLNRKLVPGLLYRGSSISFKSFDKYELLGKTGSIKAFIKKELAPK